MEINSRRESNLDYLDTTLYTDEYIDNFIKVFVEKEKLEDE